MERNDKKIGTRKKLAVYRVWLYIERGGVDSRQRISRGGISRFDCMSISFVIR